jgi:hypothetical protein
MIKLMTFFMILIFSCTMFAFSWFKKSINGSGTLKIEERTLGEFKSIDISCGFDLDVKCGEKQKVVISCDDNILPYVITEVKGDILKIYSKENLKPIAGNKITISAASINDIDLSGSSDINVDGISSEKFGLDISGSGDVKLAGNATQFDIDISGSGNATITGKTTNLNVDIAGSGKVRVKDLIAENVTVDIAGSGNAEVYASKNLDIDIAGSGNVLYYGNPAKVTKEVLGSGEVRKM